MKIVPFALMIVALGLAAPLRDVSVTAAAPGGAAVNGRVRLSGPSPGNAVIRMGMDPMCSRINTGKRILQEMVLTDKDGGLANVFVRVVGTFPQTPVPAQPVILDQKGCIYTPRVVGARVGQTLQIKNSDPLLHNVHAVAANQNAFNIGQPIAGAVNDVKLKDEEVMLPIKCDVHRWMTAYVGVVSHPYFAVSGADGRFTIANVPVGNYTLEIWHERYGKLTKPLRVQAGAPATVDFAYTGDEKAPGDAAAPAGRRGR